MELFGIKFVGINPENGQKLLLTVCAFFAVFFLRFVLRSLTNLILGGNPQSRARFWTRQGITLFTSLVLTLTALSIWFDDPTRLTTALGLVAAGLAFASQKVITSFAGYFVILRGNNFSVGDAHGIRTLKDKMSRDILKALDAAGIGIASATYDIVCLPPIR